MEKGWQVYLLECNDKTYYTGITKDIKSRLINHQRSKGAKYTRGRGPFKLLAITGFIAYSEALRYEMIIKSKKKRDKPMSVITLAFSIEKDRLLNKG